jgi:hypothetical protein
MGQQPVSLRHYHVLPRLYKASSDLDYNESTDVGMCSFVEANYRIRVVVRAYVRGLACSLRVQHSENFADYKERLGLSACSHPIGCAS